MQKSINEAVESTVNIMSLTSAVYGFCKHDDLRDKISKFITTFQSKYGKKYNIEINYWQSVWEYEKKFKQLDANKECPRFDRVKDEIDKVLTNTMRVMVKIDN